MAKEFLNGQMDLIIKDNLIKTLYMEKELINGQMGEFTKEIG